MTVNSAQGSVQITSSVDTMHMSADMCQLAMSSQSSQTVQQPTPAAASLLATMLACASQESAAMTAALQQHPHESASQAESMITRTDASLQLGSLLHKAAAGVAVTWAAVQLAPATSDVQLHAVTTAQEATCRQEYATNSMLLLGGSTVANVQGLVVRLLADGAETTRLIMAPAVEAARVAVQVVSGQSPTAQPNSLVTRQSPTHSWLGGSPAEDRRSSVKSVITDTVTRLLGSDSLADDEPLMAAGLDSLGATELVQSLQTAFDIELPATAVFDYPTVAALAGFISQHGMQGEEHEPHARAVPIALGPSAFSPGMDEISQMALITGVAGDQKLLQHWTHGDAITKVPYSRWDTAQQAKSSGISDAPTAQFGSFLPDVDHFDSALFGIMASEALTMDPQQRLLLQTALGAFPHGAAAVRGRAVGAYVGIGTSDYNTLMQQTNVPFNAFSFTAGSASVASGRLSFAFGLQGPTASIDTACSASLVAAHMACQSFR